jgi:hypothetical protein
MPQNQIRALTLQALAIFADHALEEEELQHKLDTLCGENFVGARLRCFIPEAFAFVLTQKLENCGRLSCSETFSAQDCNGEWRDVALEREPFFAEGLAQAERVFVEGPRAVYEGAANRSALMNAVNKTLNGGGNLEGAQWAFCALGVPAEFYNGS